MRGGALALGLTGGIVGLIAAVIALAIGGLGGALSSSTDASSQQTFGMVVVGGWIALGASIVGIIGGALAMGKPVVGGVLMVVAGIAGFIGISLFYVISGPLLLIGGILAFVATRRPRTGVQPLPAPTHSAGGVMSPDGQYWWDGSAWQPTHPAIPSALPPS
jgi:hypothetical protein